MIFPLIRITSIIKKDDAPKTYSSISFEQELPSFSRHWQYWDILHNTLSQTYNGVMIGVAVDGGFKPLLGQTRLSIQYLLLLCYACSIKEYEQRLVDL